MMESGTTLRLVRADVRERTRRYSYLVTLGIALYAAYVFIPPNDSAYTTMSLGGHRGIYNSAWIGTMVAMMTNAFLSLAGFYLVKNTIRRDTMTRVGQVIAATRVSTFRYLLAKWLSNFVVLASIVVTLALVAAVMQIVRGEDTSIDVWKLGAPFILMTLPMMAVVSAVAVVFESVGFLAEGLGNVLFFFLWAAALGTSETTSLDMFGFEKPIESIAIATSRAFHDYDAATGKVNLGFVFKESGETFRLSTFVWEGFTWTTTFILRRLMWIATGLFAVAMSALVFRRFDESGKRNFRRKRTSQSRKESVHLKSVEHDVPEKGDVQIGGLRVGPGSISRISERSNFLRLLRSELALMTSGVSKWWLAVAGTLIVLALVLPLGAVRQFVLPCTVIWPILLWSPLGSRETMHRTEQLLFSCPHPVRNQFFSLWCAGVSLSLVAGAGVSARFLIEGEFASLFAWCVGMLFVPSLALAMGAWTGNGKMFEIIYLIIWYIGPMNKLPLLDYVGANTRATDSDYPGVFLAVTIVLVCIAFLGRRRQALRLSRG